jgi:hypothetical protein
MIGPFSKKWSAFAQLRKQTHNSVIEQIAKGQKMTKTKRYDLPSYTEGWFQIGWSQQLPVGAIKKVEQFGKTYVLFRGEDGHETHNLEYGYGLPWVAVRSAHRSSDSRCGVGIPTSPLFERMGDYEQENGPDISSNRQMGLR